ncbi:hypothetical protein [Desulfoluna butyratoxydans]|uniref:6-bladed beta-propeller n=1 Tax=Desulfoluna butyratoxydans TaxID=231438 RepID=A0A4U8YVP4_9BACT|nr:hypothetical protein [Desulfoluna butyratoxydans]VFQ47519.1 hypothetical protein MSL71_52210 [Desulfoluna butyratoxydans]
MKIRIILLSTILSIVPLFAFASYTGPFEVICGSWGKSISEFGKVWDYMEYRIPVILYVSKDNRIFLYDFSNKRTLIYDQTGNLNKVVSAKASDYSCYNYWGFEGYSKKGDAWLYRKEYYELKSNEGHTIETIDYKPKEIGLEKNATIEYPDFIYSISTTNYERYIRDNRKNLYLIVRYKHIRKNDSLEIDAYKITRFDIYENEWSTFYLPISKYNPSPLFNPDVDSAVTPIIEYRYPFISYSGDIYCVESSEEQFKVLKWVWKSKKE